MRLTIITALIVFSSSLQPVNADLNSVERSVGRSGPDLVIPRARFLLHRWLEPAYQVRMLASFNWTAPDGSSTIF